jgi:hypothetical protein
VPGRLQHERKALAGIPFFERVAEDIVKGRYVVCGDLNFMRRFSSKKETFRVRMEYPSDFPKREQRVFDANMRFVPGGLGHMFADHGLCLSLPECEEFSVSTDDLTKEVLSASLVWFHKRLIYERLKKWPGEEYHGVRPRLEILIERAGLSEACDIKSWIDEIVNNRKEGHQPVDKYSPCPCNSLKPIKFCHWDSLGRFFKVISGIQQGSEGKHP